jgi:hypothetical protein
LIADGSVKLKSGVTVERIKEHSVVLSDGSELPADLIVYATGYGSMNGWAARLISQDVADKVGKCWGLGSGTSKDPGPGKVNCATCGSQLGNRRYGSTVVISTNRVTTLSFYRCRSRRGWRRSRHLSTEWPKSTTSTDASRASH